MKYIVASHGKLASGFQDTVEMLTQYKELYAICAYCEEEFPENLYKLIEKFPEEEIIIFADVFGGSVCREALELIQENERIHVVAGINLPLIFFRCVIRTTCYCCFFRILNSVFSQTFDYE